MQLAKDARALRKGGSSLGLGATIDLGAAGGGKQLSFGQEDGDEKSDDSALSVNSLPEDNAELIAMMGDAKNSNEIFMLQKHLQIEDMNSTEKVRWTLKEKKEKKKKVG